MKCWHLTIGVRGVNTWGGSGQLSGGELVSAPLKGGKAKSSGGGLAKANFFLVKTVMCMV